MDEIVESLKELGGTGTLNDIYDKIKKRNKIDLNQYTDWQSQIRKKIITHSSDAKEGVFKGKPGDSNDLFYSVEGKGKGVWGLRNYVNNNKVSLRSGILKIMNEYLEEKNKEFANNHLGDFVRNVIVSEFKKLTFINENYKVVGSTGKSGNWAYIPWIAIMNTNVTTSTQRGYYLVYLFNEDMERVYLTFAQGVTETSKEEMEQTNLEIRSIVPKKSKFKWKPKIQLGTSIKARQYSNSVAAYVEYLKDNIPSDEVLINDLQEMVKLYEEYVEFKNNGNSKLQNEEIREGDLMDLSSKEIVDHIFNYITSKGFNYSKVDINNLFLSLRTKPFVIISGISGTGKTKIVQLFAEAIGATEKNGQFKLIPVRPDWSDSSDLLGYRDIKGEFIKGPLTEMVEQAVANPQLPHFVLLDEMNLARVEYYFSDVLSVMESRIKDEDGNFLSSTLLPQYNDELTLPGNLYIIGTVNMDETTHSFSKKVLDRANTIEFNEIDLMNFDHMLENKSVKPVRVSNEVLESTYIYLKDAFQSHEQLIRNVSEIINNINQLLAPVYAQVGYRVRDEIAFYMVHNMEADMLLTENEAMDFCIMQKILPRIGGTQNILQPVLEKLQNELIEYPKSNAKVEQMLERVKTDGFVSFWNA